MAANVATEFSTNISYSVNDLVLYKGILYKFTSAHTAGTWDPSQVTTVDNSKEAQITRILTGMDNAEKAADYAPAPLP